MEQDLREAVSEQNPIWAVRVTLSAMRDRQWDFDAAWHSALQRLRIQPNMSVDDVEELMECKAWLEWARPIFEWAYTGADVRPQMMDGQIFTPAENAMLNGERSRSRSAPS